MATVYKAPAPTPASPNVKVFLAGSIDMGNAEEWQSIITDRLMDLDIDIYNPRRTDWDATWPQDPNFPPFREQVEWELERLDAANVIVFWFDPKGKAPVTMAELGLQAATSYFNVLPLRIVVWCPKEFWRSGNVSLICERYKIPIYQTDKEEFIKAIRNEISEIREIFGYDL
jgi:hypothetical protein